MRCMRYWCDAKLVDSAATYPARRFLARSACRSLIASHRALANKLTRGGGCNSTSGATILRVLLPTHAVRSQVEEWKANRGARAGDTSST